MFAAAHKNTSSSTSRIIFWFF